MSATGFDATNVPKKKQAAILLNIAGEEAIEVFNTFTFAEDEDKEDPEAILAKFQNYCEPKKNITYERHIFNTRVQQQTQSFDAYLTELRVQAKKCAYCTLQDELIRDRLVVGIRDDKVRSRLLREPELTLQKCIDIAHAAEISQKQIQEIKAETNTVHDVRPTNRTPTDKDRLRYESRGKSQERRKSKSTVTRMPDCKNCGTQHACRKEVCPAYGKICSSCGKGNHFARVCQSSRRVHTANIASNPDSSDDEFFIGTIKMQQQTAAVHAVGIDEWISELEINGQAVKVKLDTGAKCSVIPKSIFNQIRSNDTLRKSNTKIVSYGGHKMYLVTQHFCVNTKKKCTFCDFM
jgi:hypothetical protein